MSSLARTTLLYLSTLALALALPIPAPTPSPTQPPYPTPTAQNKSSKEYRVVIYLLIGLSVAGALLLIGVALMPWLAKRAALKALPYYPEETVDRMRVERDERSKARIGPDGQEMLELKSLERVRVKVGRGASAAGA
ncbi:hypothetical protein PTNB73_01445 [Pyrenophora teres f. teres]|uniref:Uncharacterized protein n=2 Tax=Pyrenophora teres f. teres TaxID=97479 RepID=A0A6S6VYZ0_9PLEO|nr:hypothetical protein HRS9139_00028 [Pyrenophora teres f. teres]KAE8847596.1 hypothetical protein PTNB85_01439 [Pyrenophora teres f. teres]KAE8872294.1 hypothetical protein PTNB73_01445 [Pyrenophora teres f. teres]CAE7028317.1 hypothetical protein PTTW11_04404 [Pyrenophora teres f. teres]